jgi:hypothetical protein
MQYLGRPQLQLLAPDTRIDIGVKHTCFNADRFAMLGNFAPNNGLPVVANGCAWRSEVQLGVCKHAL